MVHIGFIEYPIMNSTRKLIVTNNFNEDKSEVYSTRINKREFDSEEYEDLLRGRKICKNGFLYEIQSDGTIMMIDICE